MIDGQGGRRGPNLSLIGGTRSHDQIILPILGGRGNMPAYANSLTAEELDHIVAFLSSRKAPERTR